MNEAQQQPVSNGKPAVSSGEMDAYRLLFRTVKQQKKTVIRIVGIVTVIMLIYVLIMPQTFTSTVSLLPPQQDSKSMGLSSLLQGASGMPMLDLGSSLGLGNSPSDIFAEILKSQSVAEGLVVAYRLDDFFGTPENLSHRFAIEPLQKATEIEVNKNGVVRVSVTLGTGFFAGSEEVDSVKQFTADIANQYVTYLDKINREKLISSARNSRMFIETEIERTQAELDTAYMELVLFQKENKSVFLDKQMEAALTGAADIKEKLMEAQLELRMKKRDFAESGRIITQLEAEINELAAQYDALSTGQDLSDAEFFVPFQRLPAVARNMARYMRKVKILEQVIVYLSQQYFQDRVQEARDTPTVQVLDAALPAIQRTSPKRALWMIMTVFFSALFSVLYIMLTAFMKARHQTATPVPPGTAES